MRRRKRRGGGGEEEERRGRRRRKRGRREIKEVWSMKLLKDVSVTLTSFCLLVCPSLDKHRAAVPWYPSAGQMTLCTFNM